MGWCEGPSVWVVRCVHHREHLAHGRPILNIDGELLSAVGATLGDGGVWNVAIAVDGIDAYQQITSELQAAGFTGEDLTANDAAAIGGYNSEPFAVMVTVTQDGGQWVAAYQVTKS